MSITPSGLARTLRSAADKRTTVTGVSEVTSDANRSDVSAVFFHVYDGDGGILRVTINQYKEPIR